MSLESYKESVRVKKARRIAYERQGGLCHWCKRPMIIKTQENAAEVWDHPLMCTADHVLWRAHGGKTTLDNIVAACRECNNSRQPPTLRSNLDWPWLDRLVKTRVEQVGWGPW